MVNPFYYPYHGGTEKHLRQVSKRLAQKGHKVTVLCAQMKGTRPEEIFEGVWIIRTPATVLYKLPPPLPPPYPLMGQFFSDFNKLLEKEKPQIVHIHNRFILGPSVAKIAKIHGAKVFLTIHNARPNNIDFWTDKFGQFYDNFFGQRLMRNCDGIIGVSKWALETTIPKDYKGKTAVIHNGCDPKLYDPKKYSEKYWEEFFEKKGFKGKMFLTNVRLIKQKGLEYLIEGMSRVKGGYLVILGRGPMENSLRALVKKYNAPVYFLTEIIPEEKLIELYKSAYCFVLSSLYEPCAVALMEAQAMGLPIIATNAGGNPEIVEHGKTGLIIPQKSAKAFTEKINYLIKNEKIAKKFSKNARERSIKEFTWDIATKKTEEFYRKVLKT